MPSVTTSKEATLLQLQYVADSSGLRRSYLQTSIPSPPYQTEAAETTWWSLDGVFQAQREPIKANAAPDIEWQPSYETYRKRVQRLAELVDSRPHSVPHGFPDKIDAPRVWTGADFRDHAKYVVELVDADIAEAENALAYFKSLPGDNGPDEVSTETFPLPNLSSKLLDVANTLHFGIGFAVLRGLEPKKYSPLENVLLYLGITSYIAEIRGCQDYDGRMIVHIKDMEKELPEFTGRPSPYTSRAQPFHTDRCDILSMYALDVAAAGGESLLASSGMVYNEIAATRPDVIHVLTDDKWVFDEFRTPVSWHTRQLLHNFEEHGPGFCYSRRPLTGAPFSPHSHGVPAMTEIQAEALDMVHFTASRHALPIRLQRGDIEIFNNFALFHARNGFVDDTFTRRHMLRLWLKNEKLAWKTPEPLLKSSWEIYGNSDYRKMGRWDVHEAPPVNRVLKRRMSCS